MAVRSAELGGVGTSGTGDTTVVTCPSAKTMIVKCVTWWVLDTATFKIGTTSATDTGVYYVRHVIATEQAGFDLPWLVLEPGDTLRVTVDAIGSLVRVAAYGAILDGVA